jgi:hypothetical protein
MRIVLYIAAILLIIIGASDLRAAAPPSRALAQASHAIAVAPLGPKSN